MVRLGDMNPLLYDEVTLRMEKELEHLGFDSEDLLSIISPILMPSIKKTMATATVVAASPLRILVSLFVSANSAW